MMDWNTLDLSIQGLQQHYLQQDFSPRQLIDQLLSLYPEDDHHVWIYKLNRDELEPYLDALEKQDIATLPLYGIPFAIKDNIDLADIDTTAGCETYRYRAEVHATVVERLVQAGAIPMGKTNLDQFATGLVGTRSPWGPCKNAFNPDYISGGSSSGSAVATALGQVSFALGTDTAGSGRVPAALNNLIGLKPTRGLISCAGVVPACQSLDCVSIFALTADDANTLLNVAEGYDEKDPFSRHNHFDNSHRRYGLNQTSKILGVPQLKDLEFFGDENSRDLFNQAISDLKQLGHTIVEIDIQPLLKAARLLYEGPWISERYVAIEEVIENQPEALLPVINSLISKGREFTASDAYKAMYQLSQYQHSKQKIFSAIDALITPTIPTVYTIEQVQSDPIQLNSNLGTYTNFMNLLDLCAVAVPAGFLPSGVGFGITLQAPAFHDSFLLPLVNSWCQYQQFNPGMSKLPLSPSVSIQDSYAEDVDLVVCGAHLEGMPLNWQLTERKAQKIRLTHTSACYSLYAMEDGRPALFRDEETGTAIEVEIWRMKKADLGSFVTDIPAPLGIGKVELCDGRWLTSFIAEPRAKEGAQDISNLGAWRCYIENTQR